MALPSPEEFIKHSYNGDGQCLDCDGSPPEAIGFAKALIQGSAAPEINGALQIKNPFADLPNAQPNPTIDACMDTVNALAVANPSWSQKIGQVGLYRLYAACYYEASGIAPVGYMQSVSDLLSKRASGVPKWMWWAAAGLGAWALLGRK